MSKTVEIEVYQFHELEPKVKEKVAQRWNGWRIQDLESESDYVAEVLGNVYDLVGDIQVDSGAQHFIVLVDGERLADREGFERIDSEMYHSWVEYLYPDDADLAEMIGDDCDANDRWFFVNGDEYYL